MSTPLSPSAPGELLRHRSLMLTHLYSSLPASVRLINHSPRVHFRLLREMYDDIKSARREGLAGLRDTMEPRDHVKHFGSPYNPGSIPFWGSGTELCIKIAKLSTSSDF
jgi:hypothetical protein